jgi:hypothetical protein
MPMSGIEWVVATLDVACIVSGGVAVGCSIAPDLRLFRVGSEGL